MTIPTEAWPIIAVIFGAIAFWVRQRSTAGVEQEKRLRIDAESRALQAEGALTQVKADAEIRIAEAKTDVEERAFIREQFNSQLKLNETFPKMLAEIDARNKADNESNYRAVRDVQNDTNTVLVNMLNAMEKQHAIQIAAIGALPGAIQTSIGDSLKEYAQQLGAEIGTVLTRQFAVQNLEREMYPFPDPEDPAWQTIYITPITPTPTIHKQPYFADEVKLHKPCATIQAEGEFVRAIIGRLRDWMIVEKRAGDSHCWGWLPAHTVQVSPEAAPASA